MIQVAVVSPFPALRAGLSALIDGAPDLAVWESAPALDGLPGNLPDGCVVVFAPGASGGLSFDGAEAAALAGSVSLLLVIEEPAAAALPGLRAWGAIPPEAAPETLLAAVRALAEGLHVYSPDLLPEPAAGSEAAAARPSITNGGELVEPLTERECAVLLRLAEGLTNKQAALALGISENTVKFHVSSIYSKLGVTNRAEAVREGARLGLVPL